MNSRKIPKFISSVSQNVPSQFALTSQANSRKILWNLSERIVRRERDRPCIFRATHLQMRID